MKARTIVGVAALALAAAAAACGDSSTAPTAADLTGTWRGTTAQGKEITFEVSAAGITSLTLAYSLTGNVCTSTGSSTTTFQSPLAITGGSFTFPGAGSPAISVSGSFSGSQASGSATITLVASFNQPCSGSTTTTWTATKS